MVVNQVCVIQHVPCSLSHVLT